jgi:3-oxoacyl-[acyl-carrier-protein] synthase-3
MNCYLTGTGSFLPGEAVANAAIPDFMGELDGEALVRRKILRMNGIKNRHYALDRDQHATHDVYEMAALAARDCLGGKAGAFTYLSAGSTNTPLVGPGISSLLHSRLADHGLISDAVEINSNSGICTSSAQALVNACRAVSSGDHREALCLGVEQPSAILKSSVIQPPDDRDRHAGDLTASKWFMSVFLRSMLSDGAGAALVQDRPADSGVSYRVNWSYSRSFAHETPLCMSLESRSLLLSQDVAVLARHMKPCVDQLMRGAMARHGEQLADYRVVLPHLSSFYFKSYMLDVLTELGNGSAVDHWTNLETAGNTGAASMFIMLDEFTRNRPPSHGEKVLLFIPESGQFNFVVLSLTATHPS